MLEFEYFGLKFCLVSSRYSSALTRNSGTLRLNNSTAIFYYEAILITTSVSGNYTIQSNSTIDAYGYLYLNSFNANDMITNILAIDDDSGENGQFLISYTLQANGRYIVIMTTYFQNITAPFSIIVTGPAIVSMNYSETTSTTSSTTSTTSSTTSMATQSTTSSTTSTTSSTTSMATQSTTSSTTSMTTTSTTSSTTSMTTQSTTRSTTSKF